MAGIGDGSLETCLWASGGAARGCLMKALTGHGDEVAEGGGSRDAQHGLCLVFRPLYFLAV